MNTTMTKQEMCTRIQNLTIEKIEITAKRIQCQDPNDRGLLANKENECDRMINELSVNLIKHLIGKDVSF